MKESDVQVKYPLFAVLGMLRLATDRVAHLPVHLGEVVVPGPDGEVLATKPDCTVSRCENQIPGEDAATT